MMFWERTEISTSALQMRCSSAWRSCRARAIRAARAFVTLDDALGRTARTEGFDVIAPGR
jgi:hypothetical protein